MIKLDRITKSYDGHTVIDNLSLSIPKGAKIAITAPSGCGKTTLLHIIAGLIKPDKGQISGFDTKEVCVLFQEVRLFERFSALENVMSVMHGSRNEKKEKAQQWLQNVELTAEQTHQKPATLSGGQQQRVALARALAAQCPIMLLDEPFKGLDHETKSQMYTLVNRFLAEKTIVLVTHDPEDAEALDCEVLQFSSGMKQI